MSPSAALTSPIFVTYAALLAAIMVGSAAAIFALGRFFKRDVSHAWASYRGWLVMVPLLLLAIFLGRVAAIIFLSLAALVGLKEFARATGLYRDWWMTGVAYLGVVGCAAVSIMYDPFLHRPGWYGMFMSLPAWVIPAILLVPIVRNRSEGQLQLIALSSLGFMYLGWMFGHLAFLANSKNAYGYMLYLLVAVELNDVAAYATGKLLGRHPLRSNVSPKKTWEGAIGALVVSMCLPWALWFSFPHFTPGDLIRTGLIVGIGGQLGDLSISVIKRDLGIKDMGAMIRGHGGILDRIDSLIFVAPLFFHTTLFFHELF